MANAKALGVDLSKYLTITGSLGTDANFPVTNLQTGYARDLWKSASNASQQLTIDFGSAVTMDTLVLENHNTSSLSLTAYTLQSSPDNSTWTTRTSLSSLSDPCWVEFTAASARYWRLNWTIASGTVPPQIGNLYLASRLDFGFPYDNPFKAQAPKYETSEMTAIDGYLRSSQMYGGRKYWEIDFSLLPDATRTAFATLFTTVRGKGRAFYFLDTDGTINFVTFDLDYDPTEFFRYQQNNLKKLVLKTQATF